MEMETVGDERSSKRKETLLPRSMMSSRLVAPMTNTSFLPSSPSISVSIWFTTLPVARELRQKRERGREGEKRGRVQFRGEEKTVGGEKDGAVCAVRGGDGS